MADPLAALGIGPGDLLAGKYRVERTLAAGGMGVVVAAEHEALKQLVAIKLMLLSVARSTEAEARFRREASAAARLRSDHVVRIYDVGQHEGAPFIVMERLEGMSLERLLATRGPLPVGEAVTLVVQALLGLEEAHAAGIVHRDLKPTNLFLVEPVHGPPRVKVLDFGISKLSDREGEPSGNSITSPQAVLGTPAYIAPEQLTSSKDVDGRADLWSIGAILHELLTGHMLFGGESVGEVLSKVLQMSIPPIRETRADVPALLEAILLKCLRRAPSERFASARELREALAPFGRPLAAHLGAADTIPSLPPAPLPSRPSDAPRAQVAALGFYTPDPVSSTEPTDPRALIPSTTRRTHVSWSLVVIVGATLLTAALVALRMSTSVPQGQASLSAPASDTASALTTAPPLAAASESLPLGSSAPAASASAPTQAPSVATPSSSASQGSPPLTRGTPAYAPIPSGRSPSAVKSVGPTDELDLNRRQ